MRQKIFIGNTLVTLFKLTKFRLHLFHCNMRIYLLSDTVGCVTDDFLCTQIIYFTLMATGDECISNVLPDSHYLSYS